MLLQTPSFGSSSLPPRPLQEGSYEYVHAQSGLRFEMGPLLVEDNELVAVEGDGNEELGEGATSVTVLLYRPISLGRAKLPGFLQVTDAIGQPYVFQQATGVAWQHAEC